MIDHVEGFSADVLQELLNARADKNEGAVERFSTAVQQVIDRYLGMELSEADRAEIVAIGSAFQLNARSQGHLGFRFKVLAAGEQPKVMLAAA